MTAVKTAPAASLRRIDWPSVLREACQLIERDAPSLDALAAKLGTGRAELQRQFTRRLGTSPKAYAQALALHRLAKGSNAGRTALDAVFEAGFGSNSVAYEAAKGALTGYRWGLERKQTLLERERSDPPR